MVAGEAERLGNGEQSVRSGTLCQRCGRPMPARRGKKFCGGACRAAASRAGVSDALRELVRQLELAAMRLRPRR
jgi:hypothetical protein